MKSLLVVALSVVCFALASSANNNDLISDLPGLSAPIDFQQYAGYLTLNETSGKKLFYWFVESQRSPSTDPVVLWLNGGPGCSSLIGFLTENGPFRPNSADNGTTLVLNPFSWNKIANFIYLEAPAGVGFSYSNDPADYITGDSKTAQDNYHALLIWFARFPQFAGRPFYVSGESYGGHYVPTLADVILTGNQVNASNHINLQGILVGNGLTTDVIDLNTPLPTLAFHNLIPFSAYTAAVEACDGDFVNNDSAVCSAATSAATSGLGNIDSYDIYAPVCNSNSGYQPIQFKHPQLERVKKSSGSVSEEFDPCIDLHISTYLNQENVRKAIHADDAAGTWSECSGVLQYNFTVGHNDIRPFYEKFFDGAKISILIYSGDVDDVVPTLGTQGWVSSLNRTVVKPWSPWMSSADQIGGYVTVYDKMTFLTIRGAGHMVPYYEPALAYDFFANWMETNELRM